MRKQFFSLFVVLLLLAGCNEPADVATAESAITLIHTAYNDRDFQVAWRLADTATLRKHTTQDESARFLRNMYDSLGPVKNSSRTTFRIYFAGATRRVAVVQRTQFQRATRLENFAFLVSGTSARLVDYQIVVSDEQKP